VIVTEKQDAKGLDCGSGEIQRYAAPETVPAEQERRPLPSRFAHRTHRTSFRKTSITRIATPNKPNVIALSGFANRQTDSGTLDRMPPPAIAAHSLELGMFFGIRNSPKKAKARLNETLAASRIATIVKIAGGLATDSRRCAPPGLITSSAVTRLCKTDQITQI
jgi:hypothetical protein